MGKVMAARIVASASWRCAQCRSPRGYLCRGAYGPTFETHWVRRRAYMQKKRDARAR